MLSAIHNDVIQEVEEHDSGDSSSDGNADELDPYDQRVLKDRVLHAIEVFSKWSPNPRREILRHKKAFKLSIENRSSKYSERSYEERSPSSPRKFGKRV